MSAARRHREIRVCVARRMAAALLLALWMAMFPAVGRSGLPLAGAAFPGARAEGVGTARETSVDASLASDATLGLPETPTPTATAEPNPADEGALVEVSGDDASDDSQVSPAEASEGAPEDETVLDTGETPDFVKQLLSVAVGELGYTEGPNNDSKYGEWSGDANAAWCAEFVCWCVDQTDQRFGTSLLDVVYPNYGGQNTGRDWFIRRGRFVYRRGNCPGWGYQWLLDSDHLLSKNGYIPHPGDLMFFSYNQAGDTEHVALVEYSAQDAEGRVVVHVIEGNNPSSVQRNRYYLNNSQVLGFGACEDVVGTTMRSGCRGDKVLQLQQWLLRLGYLDEVNLTGSFGSNTKAAVAAYQKTMPDKTVTGIADRETVQSIQAAIRQLEYDTPENWLVADE